MEAASGLGFPCAGCGGLAEAAFAPPPAFGTCHATMKRKPLLTSEGPYHLEFMPRREQMFQGGILPPIPSMEPGRQP